MNHIPKNALKDISIRMNEGYDLGLALFRVSNHYSLDRQQLRQAYERKLKQEEFFFDLLLASGMTAIFFCPVFFYLLARA